MLINAVKDVASALGDLIHATKAASGKSINDPTMAHLKDSAKVRNKFYFKPINQFLYLFKMYLNSLRPFLFLNSTYCNYIHLPYILLCYI